MMMITTRPPRQLQQQQHRLFWRFLLLMLLLMCFSPSSSTTTNALEHHPSSSLSLSSTLTSTTVSSNKRKTRNNKKHHHHPELKQKQPKSHYYQANDAIIDNNNNDDDDDDEKKEKVNDAIITIIHNSRGGASESAAANSVSVSDSGSGSSSSSSNNDDKTGRKSTSSSKPPSMYWAVLHNWMYFLSLGFNLINVPFMIRQIVDGPSSMATTTQKASPEAIALSGKVESVDKFLTFLGIGFLSALSDKFGRKPLMAWSALGFMITNLIQAQTTTSIVSLYLADFVDGCSSCMLPLCQTYVTDCSTPSKRATNLGIFQGLSAGGAFIFAFPIGGILGAKYGPRIPLLIAAAIQFVNAMIIIFITPESNPPISQQTTTKLDLREANPIGSIHRLFFSGNNLLKIASAAYFLASLARCSLDAQFANYSNIRFGWTQAQSGPVLVLVGLMLAIGPRILVPKLGLKNSILGGLLIFAFGLTFTGLASNPIGFISGIMIVAIGCTCLPSLQALLANLAPEHERGALLGAVGSITELTGSIGSTLYAVILAKFTADDSPLPIPGMHFIVGSALLVLAWLFALPGLTIHKNDSALM